MGRGRTFSREFKLGVVRQVVVEERRPAEVCREHGLAEGLLLRWRREYAERGRRRRVRQPWSARSLSWNGSVGS